METNNKETFEVELFIHDRQHSEGFVVAAHDMSDHGYILLGSQVKTLNVPTRDPVEAEIEMLNKKEALLIKEHLARLHAIQQRKNDLICIENKFEDPAEVLSTLNTEENS